MKTYLTIGTITALLSLTAGIVLADSFEADWWTVDSGGYMWSTGGGFELGGTIGQPDASAVVMTGGGFELTGGFWAVPPCWCMSDLNHDGSRDGLDVQAFVNCMLGSGGDCACADVETDGILDTSDLTTFVNDLLVGASCP
jgi:hypothetical protein